MNVFNILKKACKYLNKEDEISLLNAEEVASIQEDKVCQDLRWHKWSELTGTYCQKATKPDQT